MKEFRKQYAREGEREQKGLSHERSPSAKQPAVGFFLMHGICFSPKNKGAGSNANFEPAIAIKKAQEDKVKERKRKKPQKEAKTDTTKGGDGNPRFFIEIFCI